MHNINVHLTTMGAQQFSMVAIHNAEQVDILISKNQALLMLSRKHHVYKTS